MSRHVAFLRAINVGGHSVKMDVLQALFVELGFAEVSSFLASGNIVFASRRVSSIALEQRIEIRLEAALGFSVATFLRSEAELAELLANLPFPAKDIAAAGAVNIGFLKAPPEPSALKKLLALQTKDDLIAVAGSAFCWLCRGKQSDSKLVNAAFEKALGSPTTLRGLNTLQRLDEKFRVTAGRAG